MALGVPVLLSAGGLWRDGALRFPAMAAWSLPAALDSAGFTAMKLGGYRWTVDEYVDFVVQTGAVDKSGEGDCLPFPWMWWSQMDYCCEPEIAANADEVRARIQMTADALGDTLDAVDAWRDEGDSQTPDPLPIVQGWHHDDYAKSLDLMVSTLTSRGRELPSLIGVGSVCRRQVGGPSGVVSVVARLSRELPQHVRLHLFGVKGPALHALGSLGPRVASIDSMAWDLGARFAKTGPSTVQGRAAMMKTWVERYSRPEQQLELW